MIKQKSTIKKLLFNGMFILPFTPILTAGSKTIHNKNAMVQCQQIFWLVESIISKYFVIFPNGCDVVERPSLVSIYATNYPNGRSRTKLFMLNFKTEQK